MTGKPGGGAGRTRVVRSGAMGELGDKVSIPSVRRPPPVAAGGPAAGNRVEASLWRRQRRGDFTTRTADDHSAIGNRLKIFFPVWRMKRGLSTHLECLTGISGPRLLSKATRATSKSACRSPGDTGAENKLPLVQVSGGLHAGAGGVRAMRRNARAKRPFNERRLPSEGMAASETSGWSSSLAIELVGHPPVGHSRPV